MKDSFAIVKFQIDDRPPALLSKFDSEKLRISNSSKISLIVPAYYETYIFVLFKLTPTEDRRTKKVEKDVRIAAVLEILKFQDYVSIQKYQTTEKLGDISTYFLLSCINQFNFENLHIFSREANNLIFFRHNCLKNNKLNDYWERFCNDIQIIEKAVYSLNEFKSLKDIKSINSPYRIIYPDTAEMKNLKNLKIKRKEETNAYEVLETSKKTFFSCLVYRQDFLNNKIFLIEKNNKNKKLKSDIKNKKEVKEIVSKLKENTFSLKTKENPLSILKNLNEENNIFLVWDLIDKFNLQINDFIIETKIERGEREISKILKINSTKKSHVECKKA